MADKDDKQAVELEGIRRQIDELDIQVQELISQRARYAKLIGEAKMQGNAGGPVDFYRPEREAQVLRGVAERNEGPLRDEEIVRTVASARTTAPPMPGTPQEPFAA